MPKLINEDSYSCKLLNKCKLSVGNIRSYLNLADTQTKNVNISQGNLNLLPPKLKEFLEEKINLCQPQSVHLCDGSEKEAIQLSKLLQNQKTLTPLPKYQNCWLARTNPADVARVESKTFLCSADKKQSIPQPKENVVGKLGNWISPDDMDEAIQQRFPGSMKGRTMYVIPFSMGPVGSPLAKIGIQLTDSPYVVLSMRIMTRMGDTVLQKLLDDSSVEFVRALHSVGTPTNGQHEYQHWPCDPERTIILHRLETHEIVSYGSGYGGNSLLGKKCLALRIGSYIAKTEGWLAEHIKRIDDADLFSQILGITNPEGKKRYIAAAFPSACGKTNLAMMTPTLPGYKVHCVGDDIAWMKFNEKGELRAINPENGFFGVAPGTSNSTNPIAMKTIFKNTIFTNVAMTNDGGVFWEGLEDEISPEIKITDWLQHEWKKGSKTPAAHPNSRFCSPANQCPILDPNWEDPEGVPIDAILFGGRRPIGVPLVYESLSWKHGVYIGASMRSETTAAAEYKGKFLWPGFGENSRVLDWIFQRLDNKENTAEKTAIGYIPTKETFKTDGLTENVDFEMLFAINKEFWKQEVDDITKYLDEQVGSDLPQDIIEEAEALRKRLNE
ncbi:hypothetical protein PGB90_008754 [Kerria lacca]